MARAPFGLEYKWLVAIVFVCGMFMDIMDTTIVFVATPTLARDFHATQSSIEWVVLGFVLGALYLREHREGTAGPFDLGGFLLSGAGLALVLYALSEGPLKGWRSAMVLSTGTIGLLLFALLVFVENRVEAPMLTLR